ncbi:thiamine pyrophosphate-dependent enzyme [Desulfoluna spongiiphila]|uniref:Indolepyruvate oxidoreductase subunit IorA n=1 Tax=Desulfoluna spongiiphila TaxID=419481 RepID=A0A1G5IXY3_9BACT|nr:thiamine pyrophosphate-dependent enzyme [Desulfoluna spongiiphila]SCY80570.1 indolepyruvate ferredoxin oxidoreductase alpha subunit [Desulfoluna spongiiphila]
MSHLHEETPGTRRLCMGNEAIVRGALEAGVAVAAGYPGTPSSEIIETLSAVAEPMGLYVEWSVNEKVALEVASSASFAGLRALAVMKQPGLNVASDYLLHLSASGTRGGMVLVSADDPGALSSVNEGETRPYAKLMEVPLLEPGDFQEAREMTAWAFELSETLCNVVLVRTVTRLSHASGTVVMGELRKAEKTARFTHDGFIIDPMEGVVMSPPVEWKHGQQQEKLEKARVLFETSPFNTYEGPEAPELLIITSSVCALYSREAVSLLNAEERVGILKLGTTWPLPETLVKKHLATAKKVLMVEEVLPFLEGEIKILAAESADEIGVKTFYGKKEGTLPSTGEMNPDRVVAALSTILDIPYEGLDATYAQRATEVSFMGSPNREATFCPGCPHRASFWAINTALSMDNRNGFVCGDIGCYSMAVLPAGFSTLKTLHAMGSGTGVASGFGKLSPFGMDQPVVSVCGDSTFFHSVLPPLANAIHHRANLTLVVLDNSGTAMTGFQPHPGLGVDAMGSPADSIDIPAVCKALGATVKVGDPFEVTTTREILFDLMDQEGVGVLVLKQACALSPEKKHARAWDMAVDESACLGESCGCNRLCTRVFACPGLVWDKEKGKARIDEVVCTGCGVCADICPVGAIRKNVAETV